jgi:hypothetical protein
MKQFIVTLLLGLLGFAPVYASFPVTENGNINEISLSIEDPDISKSEKILWFAIGLLGAASSVFGGLVIAVIYQLITKKEGPIKYALYGFLTAVILLIILLFLILSGFGLDFNPFIFS